MAADGTERETFAPLPLRELGPNPLVSVLIANYNYEAYVGDAIDSALNQTYKRLEVIVCDDGSTDNSWAVIEACAMRDSRVRLVRQDNAGQAWAFHRAYMESRGGIICLLDADDTFLPDKIQRVVSAYLDHPDVGMVAHRVKRVTADGKERGVLPLIVPSSVDWNGPLMVRNGGLLRTLPPCSGLSLHRDIADAIFPLFEEPSLRGYYTDRIVRRVAPLLTPVLVLPQALTNYRFHGGNHSGGTKMTLPFLEGELRSMQVVWDVQRQYLLAAYPKIAVTFAPLDAHLTYRILRYMHARLCGAGDVRQAYHAVVRHPDLQLEPLPLQWFWKGSVLLPAGPFTRAINIVMGGGSFKQLLPRLVGTRVG